MATPSLRLRSLLALGLLLALPAPALRASPQDPPQDPPKDGGDPKPDDKKPEDKKAEDPEKRAEEIKAFVKQYEDQLKKLSDQDAIDGVGKLKTWYVDTQTDEDCRKEIRGTFAKVVKETRRDALLEAAAKALGEMGGEEVVPYIRYLVDYGYSVKGFVQGVVRAGLASFGKIAPIKAADVKWLTDQLKGKEGKDDFVPDVCVALAGYAKAPGQIRRDIFEDLLKRSEGVFSKSENNDNNAKRSWNTWGSDIVDAMKKLSGQNFEKPPEFRKWFNDKSPGGGKNPKSWPDPEGH